MATINLTAKGRDQELILAYLQENASDVLADKINNGTPFVKDGKQLINKKDLNGFMTYACDEARKLAEKGARSACVEDTVVYGWAIHYFEEDSIQGRLYNQDGTEYKPPAPIKKETSKPVTPSKPKSQLSFFDMLNEKKDEQKEVKLQADDHEIGDIVKQPQAVEQKQSASTPKPKNALYEKYTAYVNRYPNSVIAMRVGDFYEILGKCALAMSDELGLTLTSRDLGLEQRVPMIGFPYHAAETYLNKLRKKYTVVVVESDGEIKTNECEIEAPEDDNDLTEEEMRLFDGDIQEPQGIPETTPTNETTSTSTDSPYDETALAKVVKLLGNDLILR